MKLSVSSQFLELRSFKKLLSPTPAPQMQLVEKSLLLSPHRPPLISAVSHFPISVHKNTTRNPQLTRQADLSVQQTCGLTKNSPNHGLPDPPYPNLITNSVCLLLKRRDKSAAVIRYQGNKVLPCRHQSPSIPCDKKKNPTSFSDFSKARPQVRNLSPCLTHPAYGQSLCYYV